MKILSKGSEGIIYLDENDSLGLGVKPYIIKFRPPKKYRHPKIDISLRKYRTRREFRILQKAFQLNISPKPLHLDEEKMMIAMEYIKGKPLSIKDLPSYLQDIAEIVNLLHDNNIIHGDLHPKNFILSQNKLYIVDFGLSFISNRVEDKAIDLFELKKLVKDYWPIFEQYYDNKEVLDRLRSIERRGRYKAQI